MNLPNCDLRRQLGTKPHELLICTHPQVRVKDNLVIAEMCATCQYREDSGSESVQSDRKFPGKLRDCAYLGEQIDLRECNSCRGKVRQKIFACHHPDHEETTLRDCRKCAEFLSRSIPKHTFQWALGVTTAPRLEPTLETCLESLVNAGWEQAHIFAEPESQIPEKLENLLVSRRSTTLGAFPNWYMALTELVLLAPRADAYFLCQDDAVFSSGLRQYLEEKLWPAPEVGVVSVYCPSHYARNKPLGFHIEDHGWDAWGALGYVFSNPSARAFLSDPKVLNHRLCGIAEGLRNIDSVVGVWCREADLPYYVHYPSLAQHIGETSTIWSKSNRNKGKRRAANFLADVSKHFTTSQEQAPSESQT